MKRPFVRQLILTLITCIPIAGCNGLGQIAQGIADNAPQAKTPEVYESRKLHTWPGDNNYYSDGYGFELYVRRGFSNKLSLKENGVDIPYFDGNDPNNEMHTVYLSTDLQHDTNALLTQTKYEILPKVGGQPHGTANIYSLVEESINPKYKGKPEQFSNPKEVKVIIVTKPCSIALFSVPPSVNVGSTAEVKWRANDCKKTELLENGSVIDEKIATGFAESIDGSKSVTVQSNTAFALRATNALGKSVQLDAKLLATAPPPCPGNSNNGQSLWFTFCATCPGGNLGDYLYEQDVLACDESSAKGVVQNNYSNCAVKSGACPH